MLGNHLWCMLECRHCGFSCDCSKVAENDCRVTRIVVLIELTLVMWVFWRWLGGSPRKGMDGEER